MSAQPHDRPDTGQPFLPVPEKSPLAIRHALLPEEVEDFDREFRAVMGEAMETLDLTVVRTFVERWWRVAWSSADPEGHRAMLETVRRLEAGEDVPTRASADIRAELGQ